MKPKIPMCTIDKKEYYSLEITPSKLTNNSRVKELFIELSRLYTPFINRTDISSKGLKYTPSISVWWEIHISKGKIKFYLIIPKDDMLKSNLSKQLVRIWKQANVKTVQDPMPRFDFRDVDITTLSLQENSILPLQTESCMFHPIDNILNSKNYIKAEDVAIVQIGLQPLGEDWNTSMKIEYEKIKSSGTVSSKKEYRLSKSERIKSIASKCAEGIGLVAQECLNIWGDFFIPGWEEDTTFTESLTKPVYDIDCKQVLHKIRSEAFKTSIRIVVYSKESKRRSSMIRSISSGFDHLSGMNKFVEKSVPNKQVGKFLDLVYYRDMELLNSDVLCSHELSHIIQVPDSNLQREHSDEVDMVSSRSDSEISSRLFLGKPEDVPIIQYEDTDGKWKKVYLPGDKLDTLCMTICTFGEPGTGKSTWASSLAIESFRKGYGSVVIDAADGKVINHCLGCVTPQERDKVIVIDFRNTKYPIGLGLNEAFRVENKDLVEDLLVEEIITYIELVSGNELNMIAKQWVENAIKAVFTRPDATIQDVEYMLCSESYRQQIIPKIKNAQLRKDWEYFSVQMKPDERKSIYDQAFRRLSAVLRKSGLRKFILQRPKMDSSGNFLFDFRRYMDEGYLVLIHANEILGETLQTALVSFIMAKLNLATISREDIVDESKRRPFFVFLDEPDHYIKGSERWGHMLTRYRKYRVGLRLMFHGWQQLVETDRNLPKLIRKSGPHYVLFKTDLENLLELKTVIEPEFKLSDLSKGMPLHHAVVKLNAYTEKGEPMAPFMGKGLPPIETMYKVYDNFDLYDRCARMLGKPEDEVLKEIENIPTDAEVSMVGEGEINVNRETSDTPKRTRPRKSLPKDPESMEKDRKAKMLIEYEVNNFIMESIERGEDIDLDLVQHMDELLEEGLEEG